MASVTPESVSEHRPALHNWPTPRVARYHWSLTAPLLPLTTTLYQSTAVLSSQTKAGAGLVMVLLGVSRLSAVGRLLLTVKAKPPDSALPPPAPYACKRKA
ncbi:MAG: hypothetical protein U0694_24835 [Anaerolineae bacterium]